MSNTGDVEKEVSREVIDYLAKTPQAVVVLFCSFLSGQLWVFVIMAYRRNTRGDKLIQSISGRVAIGFAWFVLVMVPLYLLYYHSFHFEHTNILPIAIPTIVVGLFIQVVVFIIFVKRGK